MFTSPKLARFIENEGKSLKHSEREERTEERARGGEQKELKKGTKEKRRNGYATTFNTLCSSTYYNRSDLHGPDGTQRKYS